MRPSGIILHCSDSPQGRGDRAETIHKWHLQNGWDGIGYHYVILEDGTIEAGRPEYWSGSHAKGYNDHIGICLIGKTHFTEQQMMAQLGLVNELCFKYEFVLGDIMGHYDVSSKTCPNYDVGKFKDDLAIS